MNKNIAYWTFFCCLSLLLNCCVTGNDDNQVLKELEAAFAQTPKIQNLTVDGNPPTRDQQSHWLDFEVSPGQTIVITGTYDPGDGASKADFDFSRSYHHIAYDPDDAKAVEPNNDRIIPITGGAQDFEFSYTVPDLDDEGVAFDSGDHINLTWWSSNDLGGQGFTDINLIYK